MSDQNDDLFGEDADPAIADFDRLSEILFERVTEFAADEDVADEMLPLLLLRLGPNDPQSLYAHLASEIGQAVGGANGARLSPNN
jgi:hypothetical protein